jgi:toxin ParE1/3/4
MTALPVVPRAQAARDIEAAVDHYFAEAGADVALAFIEAVERTYALLGETRDTGSLRDAHELDIPGLGYRRLRPFSWLLFYVVQADRVDIWRVLHAQSDIPEWMRDGADEP